MYALFDRGIIRTLPQMVHTSQTVLQVHLAKLPAVPGDREQYFGPKGMFAIPGKFEPMNLNSSNSDEPVVAPEHYILKKFDTLEEGTIVKKDRTT